MPLNPNHPRHPSIFQWLASHNANLRTDSWDSCTLWGGELRPSAPHYDTSGHRSDHTQMPFNSRLMLAKSRSTWSDTVNHYEHGPSAAAAANSRCYNNLKSQSSVSELLNSRLTVRGARSGKSVLFSPVSHHVIISPLPCQTYTYMYSMW